MVKQKIRSLHFLFNCHRTSSTLLHRAFRGSNDTHTFAPCLLMEYFRSTNPNDPVVGFPWHPHRGIETITYELRGHVEHGDCMGNHGSISGGDVQWMTTGSGILHQEMPEGDSDGRKYGFQLWANRPRVNTMMNPHHQM